MSVWTVYLARCADGSLYCGISSDVYRRETEHNKVRSKASRYCWSRRPIRMVWLCPCPDKPTAMRRERWVKGLSKSDKELLALGKLDMEE